MPKITKRVVDALRLHDRERVVWDDENKGFGVRVHPTGKKVYIVKYRRRGRVAKTAIGPHGPIAPAEARTRAAEIITAARTGRDSAAGGRGTRGPTMAELPRMAGECPVAERYFLSFPTRSTTSSRPTRARCLYSEAYPALLS